MNATGSPYYYPSPTPPPLPTSSKYYYSPETPRHSASFEYVRAPSSTSQPRYYTNDPQVTQNHYYELNPPQRQHSEVLLPPSQLNPTPRNMLARPPLPPPMTSPPPFNHPLRAYPPPPDLSPSLISPSLSHASASSNRHFAPTFPPNNTGNSEEQLRRIQKIRRSFDADVVQGGILRTPESDLRGAGTRQYVNYDHSEGGKEERTTVGGSLNARKLSYKDALGESFTTGRRRPSGSLALLIGEEKTDEEGLDGNQVVFF